MCVYILYIPPAGYYDDVILYIPPAGYDESVNGFSDQRFFHHRVLENRSRFTTTAVFLVFAVRVFFVLMKNDKFN
jgi:hypothetical protein